MYATPQIQAKLPINATCRHCDYPITAMVTLDADGRFTGMFPWYHRGTGSEQCDDDRGRCGLMTGSLEVVDDVSE